MGIRYEKAEDIKKRAEEIVRVLEWRWIDLNSVGFIRSHGSESRGTIARCHAMGKAMQIAMDREGYYLIEVISKRFDKLSQEEQTKVLIHELMHIPKTFGGGFKHHNIVNERNVEYYHDVFCKRMGIVKEKKEGWKWF